MEFDYAGLTFLVFWDWVKIDFVGVCVCVLIKLEMWGQNVSRFLKFENQELTHLNDLKR